jgi:copper chaperone
MFSLSFMILFALPFRSSSIFCPRTPGRQKKNASGLVHQPEALLFLYSFISSSKITLFAEYKKLRFWPTNPCGSSRFLVSFCPVMHKQVNSLNKREKSSMSRMMMVLLIAVIAVGVVTAQATKPQTVKFSVSGMTCNDCVEKVDKALRGVEGVKDVKVDLKKQTAVVTLASAAVKPAMLFKAVDDAGYKASTGKAVPSTKKEENCDGCADKEGKKDGAAKQEDCCKPEKTKKTGAKS